MGCATPRGGLEKNKHNNTRTIKNPLDIPQRQRYILSPGGTLSLRHLVHFLSAAASCSDWKQASGFEHF